MHIFVMYPVVCIDLGGSMPLHNALILLYIVSDWIEYINRSISLLYCNMYAMEWPLLGNVQAL
jgi:hypothetical protein